MTFSQLHDMITLQVINESARLANIIPVIFRKALKDIKFKGTIGL